MLAKTYSYGIAGLDAYPITIEVDVSRGLPATIIVGLPDSAVKESKERVRSAIVNSGLKFTPKNCPHRKTINLSPANTKKEGPSFDLAIAIGVLSATNQLQTPHLEKYALLGELSLDGRILPVNGTLSIAMAMAKSTFKGLILPRDNAQESAISNKTEIYPVDTLKDVIDILMEPRTIKPFKIHPEKFLNQNNHYDIDFSDVKGQQHVKRGLEIAAAGNHNCLLIGPPGSGKSMLAKRLNTILPSMSLEESLETTRIHSCMGLAKKSLPIMAVRPFRSPHHTTSDVAIVGGGSVPKPGEITLSHNGILFMDELPEFNRNVLESLRQPLEDECVTIARAAKTVVFPSRILFIAAMNPCPCGQLTNPKKQCCCTPVQVKRYISKISGPLLDRIDLHLDVPLVKSTELMSKKQSESSIEIQKRVIKVRQIQNNRFDHSKIQTNANMSHRQIKKFCSLNEKCKKLLKSAIDQLGLSARAYDKILKISRTIADLDNSSNIEMQHLAEAIQYRSLDRS